VHHGINAVLLKNAVEFRGVRYVSHFKLGAIGYGFAVTAAEIVVDGDVVAGAE
jgi:hypothetical protein